MRKAPEGPPHVPHRHIGAPLAEHGEKDTALGHTGLLAGAQKATWFSELDQAPTPIIGRQ